MAGTGKTTIVHTIAQDARKNGRLAASFFFSRGCGDVGNAHKYVTTIAVQLAEHILSVRRYVRDAVTEHSNIASQSLEDQWRHLVLGPLEKLDNCNTNLPYLVVIDALDECEGETNSEMILQLLVEVRSLKKVRLRILITSRPEVPIRYGFRQISDTEHRDFILHDIEAAIIDHDISIFLNYELAWIGQKESLGASWPGDQAVSQLVSNASGLFIWAATASRFIRDGRSFAAKRLSMMLAGSTSTSAPERHLNDVYMTVLESTIHEEYLENEKQNVYTLLKKVLGTVILSYSPLSVSSLSTLFDISSQGIEGGLADLHAILDIPRDKPAATFAPSFLSRLPH